MADRDDIRAIFDPLELEVLDWCGKKPEFTLLEDHVEGKSILIAQIKGEKKTLEARVNLITHRGHYDFRERFSRSALILRDKIIQEAAREGANSID